MHNIIIVKIINSTDFLILVCVCVPVSGVSYALPSWGRFQVFGGRIPTYFWWLESILPPRRFLHTLIIQLSSLLCPTTNMQCWSGWEWPVLLHRVRISQFCIFSLWSRLMHGLSANFPQNWQNKSRIFLIYLLNCHLWGNQYSLIYLRYSCKMYSPCNIYSDLLETPLYDIVYRICIYHIVYIFDYGYHI